jgi:hypothetical protein
MDGLFVCYVPWRIQRHHGAGLPRHERARSAGGGRPSCAGTARLNSASASTISFGPMIRPIRQEAVGFVRQIKTTVGTQFRMDKDCVLSLCPIETRSTRIPSNAEGHHALSSPTRNDQSCWDEESSGAMTSPLVAHFRTRVFSSKNRLTYLASGT